MTPKEELDLALAEVAAAQAELAAAKAEVAAADSGKPIRSRKMQRPATPTRRPVHRSDLRAGCSGTGERFTSEGRIRTDMTPVVTKQYDPMARPNDYKHEGVECLLVFDVKQGFMDSDSWKRCKCLDCAEIRRIGS